ncbi:MAG: hypothetical protein V8R51_02630 [Clostridia bacterium]
MILQISFKKGQKRNRPRIALGQKWNRPQIALEEGLRWRNI